MILRRLVGKLGQENWIAVSVELIVVIVGIFVAFQLDRWYELHRIRSDVQANLSSLAEDFAENEARLMAAIDRAAEKMEAAIALRGELRKNSSDLTVAELNRLVSQTNSLPTFHAVNLTYQNLVNSGTLVELPNIGLKKALAEFYTATELTKLIQSTQELQFVTIWQPYAMNNLDYAASNTTVGDKRQDAVLRPYVDPDLILAAMKTKKFENIIVIQWESAEDLMNNWSQLLEKVERIQAMISAQS